MVIKFSIQKMKAFKPSLLVMMMWPFAHFSNHFLQVERVTGLEPATVCLEGRNSSQLSYTRISIEGSYCIFFSSSFSREKNKWAWLGSNQRPYSLPRLRDLIKFDFLRFPNSNRSTDSIIQEQKPKSTLF